jgi:hypothetical protein
LVALTIPWKLMAILIVNNLEQPQGLLMGERVLIGRRPFNTIMVPDPAVSRIHAWIGWREGRYVLFDSGSRAGTLVNDEPVTEPRPLVDSDEIRIGPATIVYLDADQLPVDVAPLDPPPMPPAADPYDGGIYFDCPCGGPMWVTAEWAGKMGKCRYCGQRLVVPHMSGKMARQLAPVPVSVPMTVPAASESVAAMPTLAVAAAAAEAPVEMSRAIAPPPEMQQAATCSICQTAIAGGEERMSCPSCHLTFHAGCWQENYGCSAYGCDQVNVLAPAGAAADGPAVMGAATPLASESGRREGGAFPWEPVLLALSFVAMALGALAFGIPSAVMLVCVVGFLLTGRALRRGLVVVSLVVTLVGAVAGYATSMLWWKGERVWEMFLK